MKKALKIVALVVAVALIIGIAVIANALNGNPISKMLAKNATTAYLADTYPGTDYYIEELGFSFKFTGYYVHIRSDSSMDTQFSLETDMLGHILRDSYEDVVNGFVTARRVETAYRELADQIFESQNFPYSASIAYGTLEIYPQEAFDDPYATDVPDYALVQEDLILDQIYDPRELGAQAGHLVLYVDNETISFDAAAEILLDIRSQFDHANIPFRAIDFVLQLPRPEEGPRPDEEVRIENFLYENIYEEGLADRIAQAHAELEAYYAALDDK